MRACVYVSMFTLTDVVREITHFRICSFGACYQIGGGLKTVGALDDMLDALPLLRGGFFWRKTASTIAYRSLARARALTHVQRVLCTWFINYVCVCVLSKYVTILRGFVFVTLDFLQAFVHARALAHNLCYCQRPGDGNAECVRKARSMRSLDVDDNLHGSCSIFDRNQEAE